MRFTLFFILIFSILFTQEPCEGTCLSEEESQNITSKIYELQFDVLKYKEIEQNLNLQIKDYDLLITNYDLQIIDYDKKIKLQEELIKEVTPKWWENKWIWFGLGGFGTSTVFNVID